MGKAALVPRLRVIVLRIAVVGLLMLLVHRVLLYDSISASTSGFATTITASRVTRVPRVKG
jgi:hypothetical protein